MICKKIPRRHLIYSFVGLLAFFFTFSFCSSSVFATSLTCSRQVNTTSSWYYDFVNGTPACDLSSFSNEVYYHVNFTGEFSQSSTSSSIYVVFGFRSNASSVFSPDSFMSLGGINGPLSNSSVNHDFYGYLPYIPSEFSSFRFSPSGSLVNGTFTIEFSDSPFLSSSSDDCENCSFSDQLNELKQAVLLVPATLLVIYFLFCLYQILIKNGGNR